MPKLNESQQEFRRTRILDAAEICFARAGFHRTTMQDICREAGVSAGALYLYFNSKEALIEGISARSREEVLVSFEMLRASQDFVTGLAQVLQECILAKPVYKSALWLEISAEASRNPVISAMHRNCETHIRDALAALLEGAYRAGRIDPLLPIADVVDAMTVIADGLFLRRAVDPAFDAGLTGKAILAMLAGVMRPAPAISTETPLTGLQVAMEAM